MPTASLYVKHCIAQVFRSQYAMRRTVMAILVKKDISGDGTVMILIWNLISSLISNNFFKFCIKSLIFPANSIMPYAKYTMYEIACFRIAYLLCLKI